AVALILSRVTGHSPYTLTWRWNLRFTAIEIVALAAILTILTRPW
ncbi:MAG: hypothetical protein HY057_11795, partial [Rhodospirillales bacterium]|nr:hypothetical protein [Rhodospirillales bacterium]